MPPTNPTLPVFVAIAAAMPQRYDDSCSLKLIDSTFGRSTTPSMMANFTSGYSLATVSTADAWVKPTPTMIVAPRRANWRMICSRCEAFWISNSLTGMPVSFLNFSTPSLADWLNERSNLPPKS